MKFRFWFWSIIAVFTQTNIMQSGLTEEEWQNYDRFMTRKGYPLSKR